MVLKRIEINFSVGQCLIRKGIVGKLHQFNLDSFLLERRNRRVPPLVALSNDPQLDDHRCRFGLGFR